MVEEHFARYVAMATPQQDRQKLARHPDAQVIEAIIDVAFWSSLRREEGFSALLQELPPSYNPLSSSNITL